MIQIFEGLVNNLAIIMILLGLGILCGASAIAAGWVHAHWAAFILCSIAAIALSVSFIIKVFMMRQRQQQFNKRDYSNKLQILQQE